MSSRVSSSMLQDAKRNPKLHTTIAARFRCILLSSVLLILGFICTVLIFHAMYRGRIRCGSKMDGGSGKKPTHERQIMEQCRPVCERNDCLKTASSMLSNMSPETDPCEDFYNYACGNYLKNALGEMMKAGIITTMHDQIQTVIKNMIEDSPDTVPDGEHGTSFAKLKGIYKSCVGLVPREIEAQPMVIQFLEKFGIKNWPHLDSNFTFSESIEETLSHFAAFNMFSFFFVHVKQRNQFQVQIRWKRIFSALQISNRKSRRELAEAVLEQFGLGHDLAEIAAEEIVNFDLKLGRTKKNALLKEQNQTIANLTSELNGNLEETGEMSKWYAIVNKTMEKIELSEMNPKVTYVLSDKNFFRAIGKLLDDTDDRIIANALALVLIMKNQVHMNMVIGKLFHPTRRMHFEELLTTPWEFCTDWLMVRYGNIFGAEYHRREYSTELDMEALEIFEDVKESMTEIIEESEWIDDNLRGLLFEFVNKTVLDYIKYIEFYTNYSVINNFYSKLQVHDSFIANALEFDRFTLASILSYTVRNKTLPTTYVSSLDILPGVTGLQIGITLGFLILPMISPYRPRSINLGYYGTVLAHELAHGVEGKITSQRNRTDGFGTEHQRKHKCFSDHYSQYRIDAINYTIDGNQTFRENVADNIGLRVIIRALQHYHRRNGLGERLPGMDFTDEQMLLFSFAQNWCETNTLEALKYFKADPHSPPGVRLYGTLRNSPEFAEAFHCPVGSYMNPSKKCSFLP